MVWIFAYGSLIWRPGFDVAKRRVGRVLGWQRRFWQGSTDHRGVPTAPGRVVTLEPTPGAECWGLALAVQPASAARILDALDVREQGGYERHRVTVIDRDGRKIDAITYIAHPGNPNWLGAAPLDAVVSQIAGAHGPSGANVEYVERLTDALRESDIRDPHVEAVARQLALSSPIAPLADS